MYFKDLQKLRIRRVTDAAELPLCAPAVYGFVLAENALMILAAKKSRRCDGTFVLAVFCAEPVHGGAA